MEQNRVYYKRLDILRIISCIAVLLYHLNILKGGYLAVCTFFVLTGYLGVNSALNKEKFSLKEYYISKFKKIYIPLLFVVFITDIIVFFMPNINWINEKPETISVLFGYNNYWQLNANLDYFTRNISSPFTHLWYISIMLQFDLIFPILFILMKKIENKTKKIVPCILILILAIASTVYFYYTYLTKNLTYVYYDTFARIFSILFGCLVAYIHNKYKIIRFNKSNKISTLIYVFYLLLFIAMNIFISSSSCLLAIAMIAVSIVSCRIITYSITEAKQIPILDKLVKFLSKISYEIYLVQYPVIFFMQTLNINNILKTILIISSTIVLSIITYFITSYKWKKKLLNILITILLIIVEIFGLYVIYTTKDYTNEMKQLQNELEENTKLIKEKNEAYIEKLKAQDEQWNKTINDLNDSEENLYETVKNLPIVGVGDSVLLGAVNELYETFPNGYFNGKISRTAYEANGILVNLKNKNKLGDPVIFNLGANGEGPKYLRDEIMQTLGDRTVFWVTVTNDYEVHVNNSILNYPKEYSNIHIIDWNSISKGHTEYFIGDGIHLTEAGRKAYAKAIFDNVYKYYSDKLNNDKKQIINDRNNELKKKIVFYGNDICTNAFEYLKPKFENARFNIQNYSYQKLYSDISNEIKNDTLEHNVVLAFDNSVNFSDKDYLKLINLCEGHKIYLLKLNKKGYKIENENVQVIDFYKELEENPEYLLVDKIHLSKEGSNALVEKIFKEINEV